jgi:hypothetical protein
MVMTTRALHQQYIIKGAGGSDPDPVVYCPANGYVLDEPGAGTWEKILEFYTNSPSTTTFDPSVGAASDSDVAWKIGSDIYHIRALSVVLDGTLQKVELFRKPGINMTNINLGTDHIVGLLAFSHDAFALTNGFQAFSNPELTKAMIYVPQYGNVSNIYFYLCDLTGVMDLSNINNINVCIIRLYSNPKLTGVIFAPVVTGTLFGLEIYNCDLTGTIDIRMFTAIITTSSLSILLYGNPKLETILTPAATTGTLNVFYAYSCNLKGTLDMRGYTQLGTSFNFRVEINPNLTGILFPATLGSGTVTQISARSCNLQGTLDLSCFTAFSASGTILLYSNPNLEGITMGSITVGAIGQLQIYSCNLTGTLDLSTILISASVTLNMYNNPNLTEVILPTTTGAFLTLAVYSCNLSYINIKDVIGGTDRNTVTITLQDNNMTAAEVNTLLAELDSVAVGGYIGRSFRINGTNAAPDSTSGGYDGLAAKTSLQAKGFTVTTN